MSSATVKNPVSSWFPNRVAARGSRESELALPLVHLLRGLDRQLDLTHCASSTISHRSSPESHFLRTPVKRHFSMSSVQRALLFPRNSIRCPSLSSLLPSRTIANEQIVTYARSRVFNRLIQSPRILDCSTPFPFVSPSHNDCICTRRYTRFNRVLDEGS